MATFKGEIHEGVGRVTGSEFHHIDVRSGALEPVELRYHKAADAIHPHRCIHRVVQLSQEGIAKDLAADG